MKKMEISQKPVGTRGWGFRTPASLGQGSVSTAGTREVRC